MNTYACDNLSFNFLLSKFAAFDHEVCKLCCISRRTLQRYKKADDAPLQVRRLIWLRYAGLPASHGWGSMHIDSQGFLHDGLGRRLTAGEIRATFYQSALLRSSRDQVDHLKKVIGSLEKELSYQTEAANSPFYIS